MIDGAGKLPRLLVLASTYPRWSGDCEPGFVHHLAQSLAESFDVTVLAPHAPGAAIAERIGAIDVVRYRYAPSWLETLVNDGGMLTNLRRNRWKLLLVPGFVLLQAVALLRLVGRLQPDAIHAHWIVPQGLVAAFVNWASRRRPLLITSHGADLFALNGGVMKRVKGAVVRRADAVTVVSAPMLLALEQLAPGTHMRVEPMGVDLRERFTPDPMLRRNCDEILFVGRLVEKKGVRHLLAAMPHILAARPNAELSIVGFGPEEPALRQLSRTLGIADHVRFLGAVPQDQLPELYRRASVFVAPYVTAAGGDQEGLGLVAIEALGCGCPAVLSDRDVVRSALDCIHGVTFVDPTDPAALANACLHAREAPPTADSLALLRQRFDWTSRGASYRDLLLQLIAAAGCPAQNRTGTQVH